MFTKKLQEYNMRIAVLLMLLALGQLSCDAQNLLNIAQSVTYKQKGSGVKLELRPDHTYLLHHPEDNGHLAVQQCTYSSKGKWKQLSSDVLEITSENYYQKQEGFKYELKKENKLSQDSLYITVKLPDSLIFDKNGIPVSFSFTFNNNVSKSVTTSQSSISLLKQKHLWPKSSYAVNRNHIKFAVNANTNGTTLYKSRVMFEIFEEDIDTEKSNYLTITLPQFDLCFFEFEPYEQELILVKNTNALIWQGKSWEKQP